MLKVENVEVFNIEGAIRGMRNPYDSWAKSDSYYDENNNYVIGDNDLDLMRRLFNGGTEHRKYLRQIMVSIDITAPFYFWKEFDTYKVGTTANSCSTMHTIAKKPFEVGDFSFEHLASESIIALNDLCNVLNKNRELYNETKDKDYWWQLIQLLPTSYNQKRTVTMNYENAYSMLRQRKGHKLDEWHTLCDELLKLPYLKEIINYKEIV